MSMQMLDDGNQLIYEGADWDYDKIKRAYDAIERIAFDEMGLDIYPNQIEVITAEQMLDAYSSIGMPLMYKHWSFGKHFAQDETLYRKGLRGLAYEIVINSSPCISYIMEENSMTMQTLVILIRGCSTRSRRRVRWPARPRCPAAGAGWAAFPRAGGGRTRRWRTRPSRSRVSR